MGYVWGDKQRGIGELMIEKQSDSLRIVRGPASFYRDYEEVFRPWMNQFAQDLWSQNPKDSDRLWLLEWALYGLVQSLDKDNVYTDQGWIEYYDTEVKCLGSRIYKTAHDEYIEKRRKKLINYLQDVGRVSRLSPALREAHGGVPQLPRYLEQIRLIIKAAPTRENRRTAEAVSHITRAMSRSTMR
jgi:hypothetical protein